MKVVINNGRFKKGVIPWNKGKKLGTMSEEHKNKISKSMKGKSNPHNEEWSIKHSKAMKGKKHTEETKKKMSFAQKGKKLSKKTKLKLRKAYTGKVLSIEHKRKMSIAHIGKIFSDKHKKKMSEGIIKHYDKIGRKQYKRSIHVRDKKYLQWRSDVFKRDNWICQTCNRRGCYLEVHHIKSWSFYPELRYDVNNGLTLCKNCHKLTDNYQGRARKWNIL